MPEENKHPDLNLFRYATSELSQDAFLCWLLARADDRVTDIDSITKDASRSLLDLFLRSFGKVVPGAIQLEIRRQYLKIDVLLVVNSTLGIIIEDKTYTKEHSDQLSRYRKDLKVARPEIAEVLGIYFKIGDQCSHTEVRNADYAIIDRKAILATLQPFTEQGCKSEILLDYVAHIRRIENDVQGFEHRPLQEWEDSSIDGSPWIGFFKKLSQLIVNDGEGWDYVANQRGGFMGYWWHWRGSKELCSYLQLEGARLCFRLYGKDKNSTAEIVNKFSSAIIEVGERNGLRILRPNRLRVGETCTVAYLNGDYRVGGEGGILDFEQTAEKLRQCERVLDEASAGILPPSD